jgi:N-acetylglutamate synthase
MAVILRNMGSSDYPAVRLLWEACPGIGLGESDSREGIERYLERNPGLCFVAVESGASGERIIGAVLCGHDGRRGFLHHLAVDPDHRRRGIGSSLAGSCIRALRTAGIEKCNLVVFRTNGPGIRFWSREGWAERADLRVMSKFVRQERPESDGSERE